MYDRYGYDAVIAALQAGDRAALEHLHERVRGFPDGVDSFIHRHWITNAIDVGHRRSIEWMLEKKIELRFRDDEGFTVLHSCIDRTLGDKADIMAALLAAGADPDAKGINDWTPLHMAAAWRQERELVILLLRHGADRTIRTDIDDHATAEEECRLCGNASLADLIRDWVPAPG